MVKLGDGLRVLVEGVVIGLQHLIVIPFLIRGVVAAFKALGIKGIDVSRSAAGPGHLKSI